MTLLHSIRPASPADAATIVEFNQRLAWESESKRLNPQSLSPGVDAVLADARLGRYFVACVDGQIIGQLMLTYEWSDWRNGQIWWIQSVYVVAEHRRRGIFRSLYEHVRNAARESGEVVGLRLYVEENNHVAQRVYREMGMGDTGYFVLEEMFHHEDRQR